MATPEASRNYGITSASGGGLTPFRHPSGIRPHFSEDQLAETAGWLRKVQMVWGRAYGNYLEGRPDEESRIQLLTWYTQRVETETREVKDFFASNLGRRLNAVVPGSFFLQRNACGMNTCQIASAINGLRFLGVYDPNRHSEEAFIDALGGSDFARTHSEGAETWDVERILPNLVPEVRLRRSNSVSEMLRAAADGAAVMFPYDNKHEALIPPGFQLRRTSDGTLGVQVVNPLNAYPEFLPVDELVKSEITCAIDPSRTPNSVLIIERVGIRTAHPIGIRTATS